MPRRSPIIFWLLLAATLCVDVLTVAWVYAATLNRTEVLYYGLSCGQLSVLCIWVALRAQSQYWWWMPPASLILLVTMLSCGLYDSAAMSGIISQEIALAMADLLLSQAALLLAILWVLQQTSMGRTWAEPLRAERWRFSLKQIFAVMTAVAVILIAMRQSKLIREVPGPVIIWIINNALLATAAVVIRGARLHGVVRLAVTAGIAIVLGLAIRLISSGQANGVSLNLIQAIVLYTWLEFGEIFPGPAATAGGSAEISAKSTK